MYHKNKKEKVTKQDENSSPDLKKLDLVFLLLFVWLSVYGNIIINNLKVCTSMPQWTDLIHNFIFLQKNLFKVH